MDATVGVAQGALQGRIADGVYEFLGVPYAAPPFGANRLRPPAPPEPWTGVRDATTLGPEPPQVAPPTTGGPAGGARESWAAVDAAFEAVHRADGHEDCLNLNIWTPDPGAAGMPVMVWIQGGMFEISSTAAYDGSRFARDGVVCVVINWRPGAEGFLYLGDGIANVGLLDQVAALEWVHANIAACGGDPGNVTVFGESAGAMSIGTLLSMPAAKGLFRRAIAQSGAAHMVVTPEDAHRVAHRLADLMGVPPTREAIAAAGTDALLAAQAQLKAQLLTHPDPEVWGLPMVTTSMQWQPVVDGLVLPGVPIELVGAGAGADVDLVVGTNVDDWRLFLAVSGALGQVTEEVLTGPVGRYGYQSLAAYGVAPDGDLAAAYRERYSGVAPGELLAKVQTDWWMRMPAIRLAEARAGAAAGTFMYEFAWATPGLGAVHALEVPFVFDTLSPDAPLFGPLLGPNPPQGLADRMHAAWVAFATDGDPGWPNYEGARRTTMRFDTVSQVVEDPRGWERALWDGIR